MVEPADLDIPAAVAALHREDPARIAVLSAMCDLASENERLPTGTHRPMFDAEMVWLRLGEGARRGNLAYFVKRGFIEPDDQTNHRYYVMPRWREIREALDQLRQD